jgi:cholesterol transport system auxiliary component
MKMLCALLAGCALTSKSAPIDIEYFTPVLVAPSHVRIDAPTGEAVRLRLGKVKASDHLRAAIVHRASSIELGIYHSRRWTERPDRYVRRALESKLFADRTMVEAISGSALTLDVEVLAFEEIDAPEHAGLVELRYRLRDDRSILASGTATARHAATGTDFATVVSAISAALDEASAKVATAVRLAARREVKLLPTDRELGH